MLSGCVATIDITTSEPDTKLTVDGMDKGINTTKIKIPKDKCATVKAQKGGFLTQVVNVCYKDYGAFMQATKYITMQKDDSYDASVKTDQANLDFAIVVDKKLSEAEAWKLISQIVTNYFDLIEMADKETGYLRTNWSYQTFSQNSVRTRILVKQSNSSPLTYKVKIISEASGEPNTPIKKDESFKEWDRVLRKYQDVLSEFQTRLTAK